jgi:peptide deformylase
MGHPVLRQKCKPIDPNHITGSEIQQLIRDMFATMVEYGGVGLAAPQVYEPVRLVIAGGEEDDEGHPRLRVLINPEISVADPDDKIGMYEGCLSIPDLRGYVERPAAVHVEAYNERGEKIAIDLEGFSAVVLQHECDHLDGILYIDRIEDTSQLGFEREVARFLDLTEEEDEDDSEQEASGAD